MEHPIRNGEKGYTLVACLIVITLLLISLGVATQVWSHLLRRDAEEELIFRGNQYVEAIRVFQIRHGRLPMKLEELIKSEPGKPRCIRRLWKDPITHSDKWGLVFADGRKWPPVKEELPEGEQPEGSIKIERIEIEHQFDLEGQEAPVGPIVGVFSTSDDESIREYNGRKHYNEWVFSIRKAPGRPTGGPPGSPQGKRR